MQEKECPICGDSYPADYFPGETGTCLFCLQKQRFSAFAESCGLSLYPDPSGERYVFRVDGQCEGKKSESIHLIDELWNALVRAKDGAAELLLPRRS